MSDYDPFKPPKAVPSQPKGTIQTVPFTNGFKWITRSFALFSRNPVNWIIGVIIVFAISIVVSMIPLVSIIVNILAPVFMGGFMIGCRQAHAGSGFEIEHVFAGFKENTGPLAMVGLIYFGMWILLMVLMGILLVAFLGMETARDVEAWLSSPNSEQVAKTFLMLSLGIMALAIPLIMAYWFAPALVVFRNYTPFDAMRVSFKGCLRNMLPFLAYGIFSFLLVFLGVITVFLGFIVIMPLLVISVYTAYIDIFPEAQGSAERRES